jgi:hypothetical protein
MCIVLEYIYFRACCVVTINIIFSIIKNFYAGSLLYTGVISNEAYVYVDTKCLGRIIYIYVVQCRPVLVLILILSSVRMIMSIKRGVWDMQNTL